MYSVRSLAKEYHYSVVVVATPHAEDDTMYKSQFTQCLGMFTVLALQARINNPSSRSCTKKKQLKQVQRVEALATQNSLMLG